MVKDLSGNGVIDDVGGGPKIRTHSSGQPFAITPDDDNDLERNVRGVYIGGAGNLTVMKEDGTTETFVTPLVGTVVPVQTKRVMASGTTASNLMGMP